MRTYKITAPVLILGLLISSCQKFLDIKKNSTQSFIETANDCQLLLDNYNVMNIGYPSDGEASADDYFLNVTSYNSAVLTQEDRDIYRWLPGAQRDLSSPQWLNSYLVVNYANLVLEAGDKLKNNNTDEVTRNTLRGSALFFRSFAFWSVAQLYAKPYTVATAAQDPGIPLRLGSDLNAISSRGTVKQTYDRIVQDLQEAVNLLPSTSSVVTRPNKAAAHAMLARVYLSMGDYPNALSSASAALAIKSNLLDFNTKLPGSANSNTPFSPRFSNPEIIFHSVMANNLLLNTFVGSQSLARINTDLVNSYAVNDIRKTLFLKPNTGAQAGSFRFTGNYEPTVNPLLFNGLTTDELYVTRAECYARTGDKDAAMADLNTLLVKRYITGTYVPMSASTATEAVDKALLERRKELLMRGLRWTDVRRLKLSISRQVVGLDATVYSLPADDLRSVLLIPRQVVQNSPIAQNPR